MTKRLLLALSCLLYFSFVLSAQLLSWAPDFPKDNDNISITVDASKGNLGLQNYSPVSDVYVHTGVITNLSTSPTNWRYVKFNQNFNIPNAQLQAISLGGNKWRFDITNIRAYYGVPAGETILRIAILFRNGAGTTVQRNANGDDMYIPVYDNSLAVRFTVPAFQPLYTPAPEPINKSAGDNIAVTAIASQSSSMKLYLNGSVIQTATAVQTLSANPVLTAIGNTEIVAEADNGSVVRKDTFRFFVAPVINIAALPAGVRDGINYEGGNTAATLVLYAPGKSRVSLIGEFPGSNWVEQSAYVMNKTPDGNYWWLRITGLSPGTEYAFQYLVDGALKIGEPYAEKILDPSNDPAITAATYPGLRSYPTGLTSGIVSLLQTGAPAYTWANTIFSRPDKRNLVIYELLLRDFVAAHDWKTLRDTLNYFKRMGINAIEIMPFNEFENNNSWGYNPSYFLAPDKYYGPRNSLKEFVDSCHSKGIAVIMDIALNHTTGLNPLAALYWNASTSQPAANNPWLNVTATHPFNVFNDFNHQSPATQYFFKRVVEHWLQEYKLDGFRFDLSKGFTQTNTCTSPQCNSGSEVSNWSSYDATRVALWKKYYDTLQVKSPGSYVILEHFADNTEEMELSNYGMLLWGNMNYNFNEASMGYVGNSNFEAGIHSVRGWTNPHLVTYMESHDEERMMYKNLQFGNASGSYNTKDLSTALRRIEQCAAFLLTIPGPKMIWEFGELGYDFSINRCEDGTINNNCRTSPKPIRWDYLQQIPRQRLYDIFSSLSKLRFHPWYKDAFIANNINLTRSLAGAFKWMTIRTATDSSNLVVVGNFDVSPQSGSISFPQAGTWYDYLEGTTFTATGSAQTLNLQPGEFHIYLNRNLVNAVVTPVTNVNSPGSELGVAIYPNPAGDQSILELSILQAGPVQADLLNCLGQKINNLFTGNLVPGKHRLPLHGKINNLAAGMYFMRVQNGHREKLVKVLIQ
ncbi:MAG TPA: alpha-amylase family glycosyl hydrolase [Chitinophagaceae bacterium]|nr:alpha-amylase family glycosyl hydrolase [Chitinophagaceae bacterium]